MKCEACGSLVKVVGSGTTQHYEPAFSIDVIDESMKVLGAVALLVSNGYGSVYFQQKLESAMVDFANAVEENEKKK